MTKAQPTEATQPAVQRDDAIRCKACEHAVTRQRHALERDGRHEHTFRNPAGYSFHVLCYGEAEGSRAEGHPTTAATWFPGFAWSFALCGRCGEHLGWWYSSATESFAGLIATRLLRPLE
jgi:hypothetical protein